MGELLILRDTTNYGIREVKNRKGTQGELCSFSIFIQQYARKYKKMTVIFLWVFNEIS